RQLHYWAAGASNAIVAAPAGGHRSDEKLSSWEQGRRRHLWDPPGRLGGSQVHSWPHDPRHHHVARDHLDVRHWRNSHEHHRFDRRDYLSVEVRRRFLSDVRHRKEGLVLRTWRPARIRHDAQITKSPNHASRLFARRRNAILFQGSM